MPSCAGGPDTGSGYCPNPGKNLRPHVSGDNARLMVVRKYRSNAISGVQCIPPLVYCTYCAVITLTNGIGLAAHRSFTGTFL